MFRKIKYKKGTTLLETLIAIFIIVVTFVAITSLIEISIKLASESRAYAGASTIAQEHMEYLRSLSYDKLGTQGGIPSGDIPQTVNINLNNIDYTKRTLILYIDDEIDGKGSLDEDNNVADYKVVKTQIKWTSNSGKEKSAYFISYFASPVNKRVSGGVLKIRVLNQAGEPISNAKIQIVNELTNPPINLIVYSDSNGEIEIPGVPPKEGYKITVTKPGYGFDKTYSSTVDLPNPIKPHITIADTQVSLVTFTIDLLSNLYIYLYKAVYNTFTDNLDNTNNIDSLNNIQIATSTATLVPNTTSGYMFFKAVGGQDVVLWDKLSFTATGDVRVKILDINKNIIPDSVLSGNSTGFTNDVPLTSINPNVYNKIIAAFYFAQNEASVAKLDSVNISYFTKQALPNKNIHVQGQKLLGYKEAGIPVYKFDNVYTTDSNGSVVLQNIEADTYTINASTTPDVLFFNCPVNPLALQPNTTRSMSLVTKTYIPYALRVIVKDENGNPISSAKVTLQNNATTSVQYSNYCGQVLFENLDGIAGYLLKADKQGYVTASTTIYMKNKNQTYELTLPK